MNLKKILLPTITTTSTLLLISSLTACNRKEVFNLDTKSVDIEVDGGVWKVLRSEQINEIKKDSIYHLSVDIKNTDGEMPLLAYNIWNFTILDNQYNVVKWSYKNAKIVWKSIYLDKPVDLSEGGSWNFDSDNHWIAGVVPLYKEDTKADTLDVDLELENDLPKGQYYFAFLYGSN